MTSYSPINVMASARNHQYRVTVSRELDSLGERAHASAESCSAQRVRSQAINPSASEVNIAPATNDPGAECCLIFREHRLFGPEYCWF
ncbi:hypothetical protein ElyMa_005583800 [Elysia marginata]|uniref:Uncharacterized protein n=1 Tax=Elysia marginata TaxID=1093978 RepID=A0AAV4F2I7_9GAST|nr:hypothetical protein ElyMa_005583800 [Elysia marginata]